MSSTRLYPKVSIIILNWNGINLLKQSFPSILALDYPNYEIIFVDNNSSDKSIKMIEEMTAEIDIEIKIVQNPENYGYSKGKNIGSSLANGSYLWLLDNDIILNKKSLSFLVEFMENNPECGATTPALIFIDRYPFNSNNKKFKPGGNLTYFGSSYKLKEIQLKNSNQYDKLEISYPHGATFFIRKKIWDILGGFDETNDFYLDDTDLGVRVWISGYKCYCTTKAMAYHIGVPGTYHSNQYLMKYYNYIRGINKLMLKNYEKKTLIVSLPMFFAFSIIKSVKLFLIKKNPTVIVIFFKAYISILNELKMLMDTRKKVQTMRTIKDTEFLNKLSFV
jgi:GT2 family glycosyltransferase